MRTIKFRAWDKEKNRMWYSGFDVTLREDGICSIVTLDDNYERTRILFTGLRNDPEEAVLMQFTGLLDKNGKEIYEGDILKLGEGVNVVVSWSDKFGGFTTSEEGTTMFGSHLTEVIGNIYEKPELL